MVDFDRKSHWEKIYKSKQPDEVSWYQPIPETSLDFIRQCNVDCNARIIDIGGGDSFLVDHLIENGYQDITVLDISESAIKRAKKRLGPQSAKVRWIISDVTSFDPKENYDIWHDRATFHFLTDENDISKYVSIARQCISPRGFLILGTFSDKGPKKCSGIEIKQYSENMMDERFHKYFKKIKCITVDHKTPSGTAQNFIFCSFLILTDF